MPPAVRNVLALAAVLMVAGGVLYAVGDSTVRIVALLLIGTAAVAITSSGFYLVGLSEDRERDREAGGPGSGPGGPGRD
jgi:hypothetical protein